MNNVRNVLFLRRWPTLAGLSFSLLAYIHSWYKVCTRFVFGTPDTYKYADTYT